MLMVILEIRRYKYKTICQLPAFGKTDYAERLAGSKSFPDSRHHIGKFLF